MAGGSEDARMSELTEADAVRTLQLVQFAALSLIVTQTQNPAWAEAVSFPCADAPYPALGPGWLKPAIAHELRELAHQLWPEKAP